MGTREKEEPSLPDSTSQLYFLIPELRQTPYFYYRYNDGLLAPDSKGICDVCKNI